MVSGTLRGIAAAFALTLPGNAALAEDHAEMQEEAAHTPNLLVYSATTGWRHDSIPAAAATLVEIAKARGWDVTVTENPEWFDPDRLFAFDAIIWASPTGGTLDERQRSAFRAYIEQHGGGFVGIHSAGDASHEWDWYQEEMIGPRFIGHPNNPGVRNATITVEQPDHPIMQGLPVEWQRLDEWYSYDASARGKFTVLASLREETYVPPMEGEEAEKLAMGEDHPIIWHRCVGAGRSFYSGLGHTAESYADDEHRMMLGNAIVWAMGEGDCPES